MRRQASSVVAQVGLEDVTRLGPVAEVAAGRQAEAAPHLPADRRAQLRKRHVLIPGRSSNIVITSLERQIGSRAQFGPIQTVGRNERVRAADRLGQVDVADHLVASLGVRLAGVFDHARQVRLGQNRVVP